MTDPAPTDPPRAPDEPAAPGRRRAPDDPAPGAVAPVRTLRAWLTAAIAVTCCLLVLVVWAGYLHAVAKDRFVQLPPGRSAANGLGIEVGVVSLTTATTRDDLGRERAPADGQIFVVATMTVVDPRHDSRSDTAICELRLMDDGPSSYMPVADSYSCGDGLSASPSTIQRTYEIPESRVGHVVGIWNRSSDLSARAGAIIRPAA